MTRLFYTLLLFLRLLGAELEIPGLADHSWSQPGDLDLAALLSVHNNVPDDFCSDSIVPGSLHNAQVIPYAARLVNEDPDLLPNITLGFTVLDTCYRDVTALARVARLLFGRESRSEPPVVGLLGPGSSRQAVMVSSLVGLYAIPTLSPTATSDELSDKSRFPYFMRMLSPDKYQSAAIVAVLEYFGWSYVSVVYSEGSYGENLAKLLLNKIKSNDTCVAESLMVSSTAGSERFSEIVRRLDRHSLTKVVVLAMQPRHLDKLYRELDRQSLFGRFVFLGSDSFSGIDRQPAAPLASGSLLIYPHQGHVEGIAEYLDWAIRGNSSNPLQEKFWRQQHNCSWSHGDCDSHAAPRVSQRNLLMAPILVDGVMVYARALHQLIDDHCPEEFQTREHDHLRACIRDNELLDYMKNVSFSGRFEQISFDENGDMFSKFTIRQYIWAPEGASYETVGAWDRTTGRVDFSGSTRDWVTEMSGVEAVCSRPCPKGHFYQEKELPCCWECQKCRENEIVDQQAGCQSCPIYTWPDDETRTRCEPIAPYHVKLTDTVVVCLICLAAAGVVGALALLLVYAVKRRSRLLKASSRELSLVVLAGCCLACVVSLAFFLYPTRPRCVLRQIGFHFSLSLIFVPLLLKTCRIYRIFAAGQKGLTKPRLTSSFSQLVLTAGLSLVQLALLAVLETLAPSRPELLMPFPDRRYVEITCSVSMTTFLPPLCVNIVFIVACAAFGFLTRKLPENFNDSRYIFVSIATTAFAWLVFLPTYFTTFYSHHQAVILAVGLLLNAHITLVCQFAPKTYAVFFVKDDKIIIKAAATSVSAVGSVSLDVSVD